ncbi:Holliday junction resolvase RuvX [Candidatus Uhrbacteria bacterium]|nr:Holliday junction resolvase RuvX [Candidatus Uhrbacteria bacterium]
MRYLGIDYGSAHIGIALGDDETRTALPLETIPNDGAERLSAYCSDLIAREGIGAIVVGVPAMGNVYGEQKKVIEDAITKLQATLSIPVHAADESFSSRQAQALLREKGPSPSTDEHAIAAMVILQGYLDRLGG